MHVIEPLLDRRFLTDSYPCRKAKGRHAAVARYQHWAQYKRYAVKDILTKGLAEERLRLHPRKAGVIPVATGLDLLGYRIYPHKRLLRDDNGHRFARKLRGFAKGYAAGRLASDEFNRCFLR